MKTPQFWKTFSASAVQLRSYPELAGKSLKSTVWYLVRLLFIITVIQTLILGMAASAFAPMLNSHVTKILKEVPAQYPKGLVITVQTGALTLNRKGPVHFDLGPAYREFFTGEGMEATKLWESGKPKYMVTIDPTKTTEDYRTENSVALFTSKGIVMPDRNGGIRMVPYGDKTALVTDKTVADTFSEIEKGMPKVKSVLLMILVVSFTVAPFLFSGLKLLGWMLVALPVALIALGVSKVNNKRSWTYAELYRATLYGVTPVVLLRFILPFFPGFSPLPTWILILWMIMVVLYDGGTNAAVVKKVAKKGK
jgi:hypothetical protein